MSRVALIGTNSPEFVDKLIDIWNSGDCAVLIDSQIPGNAAVDLMREASVDKCYHEKGVLNNLPSLMEEISFEEYEVSSRSATYLTDDISSKYVEDYSTTEAVVIYSSGTTGKSKGIILSHYALSTNADAINDYMHLGNDDTIYIARSLAHLAALTGELLVGLKAHAKIVIAPIIVPPRFILNNLIKFNATVVCLSPTLLSLIVEECGRKHYELPMLRAIYTNGAKVNDKLYVKARNVLTNISIYNSYGLSEAGPRVTSQTENCCKGNSAGKPIKGVRVQIIDECGNVVENGRRGIIHVDTPSRFSGYISGKEKNPSLYNNWINTGDVGYFDEEGELHIVDRADDMIIIDSHKIYPSDIERKIIMNTSVYDCVVVKREFDGIDKLCCLYRGDEPLTANQLVYDLLPYEIPKIFVKVESFPQTNNGKISRQKIQEMLKGEE